MLRPDINQLEERVLFLMEEFRRIKKENDRLTRKVDELNREKEMLIEEKNLEQDSRERLSHLESLNSKNKEDRKIMQMKVQNILENLEKFDLS
jgi:hypothetical protein